jgi:DNA-binding NarL/FixJ family response regulator
LKSDRGAALGEKLRAAVGGVPVLSSDVTKLLIAAVVARPEGAVPAPQLVERLSPRERDVLGLIGRGRDNSEIARELCLAESTVKSHINHMFAKLDVRDRAQAAIVAVQSGITRH